MTKQMMKKTGYAGEGVFPRSYPYSYFDRCSIQELRVMSILEMLNGCDVYDRMHYYSLDEHKNHQVYSPQASDAYPSDIVLTRSILLSYFCPSIQQKANDPRFSSLRAILTRVFDQFAEVHFGPGLVFSLQGAMVNAGALSTSLEQLMNTETLNRVLVGEGGGGDGVGAGGAGDEEESGEHAAVPAGEGRYVQFGVGRCGSTK